MIRPAAAVLLTCLCLAAGAAAATLDDRVYAVARRLMCPVCVGQTVAESDSALAREMKAIIRQKLEAGERRGRGAPSVCGAASGADHRRGDRGGLHPPVAEIGAAWRLPRLNG